VGVTKMKVCSVVPELFSGTTVATE
jgi:hypothetical protein